MKKIQIDWMLAKREFLLDHSMSLKDVAKKYRFSYSKIKKVSAEREWYKDKKRIQEIISEAIMKEVEFKIKERLVEQARKIKPSLGKSFFKKRSLLYKKLMANL